ncbi:hypothetical protein F5883DRAFT_578606 [Diaporthe sp. PMI_573]|nr:hypothetical protein F5883DRAFT_578606 [Diaporthaceae sp. PMI_573]
MGSMSNMQKSNRLKTAFVENKCPSLGLWQMLPSANISRVLARSGVDWVMVDCEHGNIDDGAMHEAVPAIAACSVSPLVRVPVGSIQPHGSAYINESSSCIARRRWEKAASNLPRLYSSSSSSMADATLSSSTTLFGKFIRELQIAKVADKLADIIERRGHRTRRDDTNHDLVLLSQMSDNASAS